MSRDQLTVVGAPPDRGRPGPDRRPVPLKGGRQVRRPRPDIDLDELWAPLKRERAPEDREFLPGALEILEAPASPIRIVLIYALCGLIAAALAWSWFGHLDVYADATGKVQASGRTKVVQPLDSGTVIKILGGDGMKVKEGAPLIELDPSEAIANETVARDALTNARAEILRRQAAVKAARQDPVDVKITVPWTDDIPQAVRGREEDALHSDLATLAATIDNLKAQKAEAEAQRDKYAGAIVPQKQVNTLLDERVGMTDQMFTKGWNSRLTVIELMQQKQQAELALANINGSLGAAKASIAVIDSQIAKTVQSFTDTNTQAYVTQQQKVDELVQALAKAELKVTHMTLRAPISGIVQATSVTTIGQVVGPGQQLMQVVPEDAPLEIEAYILNTDAGFVKVGQDVTIKVDTFPYTRYGTIDGTVTKVAADALTGKQAQQQQTNPSAAPDGAMTITSAAQQTSDLVFPVIIKPKTTTLMVDGKRRSLTSGMTATVEIRTESRRAIDYILSPIQSALSSAAQER